jgi:cobalt-zinc-cadmium efflux system outer membrane protein
MKNAITRPVAGESIIRRSSLTFASVASILVPAFTAASQETTPTLRLSDVYVAVAERNPKAAAARFLVRAAEARISPAAALPDPQVQLGFMNYALPGLRPMEALGMVQLQVMQMVPMGGKLPLSGRIVRHQSAAQRERAGDAAWELRTRAAMAFYELFQAEQGVALAKETRQLVQHVARIAQTMYEVGEGNQADALRAQVELARMTEEIAGMEAMRASAVAKLNALIDRPLETDVPAAARPVFPDSLPMVDSLLRHAMQERPMIRAGQQDVEAASVMSQRARRELIPDLVLGVQYGQRRDAMGTERMGSLMIGAAVPLFAGRRQQKWRDEADAMRAMAEADLTWMKADTRGRVGEVMAMLIRSRRLAELYTSTVLPQAEAAVTSALSAYRVGRVDFMTVLDNRMTVNRYRMELVALQADEGKAWAELEMLSGRELIDSRSAVTTTMGEAR